MMEHTLHVERKVIGNTRTVEVAGQPLGENQVRLSVDRFAVTANNITYAVFGDLLSYWNFFPVELPFGQVPAMGWAEVVESNNPDIAIGGRYYGWFPMASTAVFTATAVSDGFRDDGSHRQHHAPVYRSYVETKRDGMYDAADDGEDRQALLRGLFLTGYLAEEFFADSGGGTDNGTAAYFGAQQVVVLSASSKTAIGFAQRAVERSVVDVVGVTSAGNADFVRSIGCYDKVVIYDEVADIDASLATVSIDMAGNPTVLGAVHTHLGNQLKYSMAVGRSHHGVPGVDAAASAQLPGPPPQLFFAPSEVGRRWELWGREAYQQRCADALAAFVEGSRAWLSIDHRFGPDGAAGAWADVYDGSMAPSVGVVVLPNA